MRGIKFRGKRIDNVEWVYGYLSDQNTIHGFVRNEHSSHGIVHDEFECEVDPETVGQYTGLKDKNGKEIYEGDILDGSWINPISQKIVKRHYRVIFEKANFYAQLIGHHPYGTTMLYFENEKGEIIGNIYESPSEVTP